MQALARILLPVDFSERSAGAARYASFLAGRFHSEILLLHVVIPPQYEFGALDVGGSMISELYRYQSAQAARELDDFVGRVLPGLNVRQVVLEGDPARRTVEFAHQEGAGLIVMPTHGYGPFRRFILGSNTAKVLHDADCPVWTGIHLEEAVQSGATNLDHVLCAVDLGPQSGRTLAWAAWFAAQAGARLTLLHVASCGPDPAGEERLDPRTAARQELVRLQGTREFASELLVETGEPPKVICAVASRVGASVLVIGRGSAAGVFGRLRTNAYAIIRQSPCPVVSV
jgi:nucleotide-binding universal stress UspA family protein